MTRREIIVRSAVVAAGGGPLLSLLRCGENAPTSLVPPDLVRRGLTGCGLCEEACIVKDKIDGHAIRVRSEKAWS